MRLEASNNCPLDSFKSCRELKCSWFMHIRGTDKNTKEEVDEYRCVVTWIPTLLIENASLQNQTGAAIESFRNEMVKANNASLQLLTKTITNPDIKTIEVKE